MEEPSPPTKEDCVHTHPIPTEQIARYSVERDPDAEQDIANYVHGQAQDETVQHVEKVKSEYIIGDRYDVWDVTTDKNRWWVVTNLTNLYSQQHFPSLDYTLSFHVGLMMRMRSRPEGPDVNNPDPFDEVFRRRDQASERLDRAVETEDFQAVGMQFRECLLSLLTAVRRRLDLPDPEPKPKEADFRGWSEALLNHLCPGESNKELRAYMKGAADKTWQLVNWMTHHRDARDAACSITAHACDTLIGNFVQLVEGLKTDNISTCPVCASRAIRTHFDIGIEPDGEYYTTCGSCGWSSHPSAGSA